MVVAGDGRVGGDCDGRRLLKLGAPGREIDAVLR